MYQEITQQYMDIYHRQNTRSDCGEACAESVIYSYQNKMLQQKDLISDLTPGGSCNPPDPTMKTGWGTNPYCLNRTFRNKGNHLKDTGRLFNLIVCNSEPAISRWLVYNIFSGGTEPCVVVDGKKHWVTVYACEVDKQPAMVDDPRHPGSKTYTPYEDPNLPESCSIKAFYVYDPAPNPMRVEMGKLVTDIIYTHTAAGSTADDDCGTGIRLSAITKTRENWGLAYRRISYKFWQSMVLNGIPNNLKEYWRGKFLAVVDAAQPFIEGQPPPWDPPKPQAVVPLICKGTASFIGEGKAKDAALQGLIDDGFMKDSLGTYRTDAPQVWRDLLDGTVAQRAHRVDPAVSKYNDFSYYVVEMEVHEGSARDGQVPVVVMVNACTPEVLDMAAVRRPPGVLAIVFIDKVEMVSSLLGKTVQIDNTGPFVVTPADLSPPPYDVTTVWSPAEQSLTPYAPFYKFTIRGKPLYVRVDFEDWFQLVAPVGPVIDLIPFTQIYSDLI